MQKLQLDSAGQIQSMGTQDLNHLVLLKTPAVIPMCYLQLLPSNITLGIFCGLFVSAEFVWIQDSITVVTERKVCYNEISSTSLCEVTTAHLFE